MTDQNKQKDIADKVLDRIESKHVKMRPKAYFVAGSIVLGIGLGAAMLTALYFIGLSTFRLRTEAPFDFLALGIGGVRPFLATVPWPHMLVAVVGISIGVLLVRKYRFGYRHSIMGITIGMVGAMLFAGIMLQVVGAHRLTENLPIVKGLYAERFVGESWLTGYVTEIDGDEMTIITPYDEKVLVILHDETHIQPPRLLKIGEWLRAVGIWDGDTFEAEHVLHGSGERFKPRVKGELHRLPPINR